MIGWGERAQVRESVGSGEVSELRSVGFPLIGYVLGLWSQPAMVTQYVTYPKSDPFLVSVDRLCAWVMVPVGYGDPICDI
jgi:hypothetical protein